ncbi:hypothetical protein FKM82_029928, partial [Ascaphus truei]
QICANLDTVKIMSAQTQRHDLEAKSRQPKKQYDLTTQRAQDPFGLKLKEIMGAVHEYLDATDFPASEFGTQVYEQKIVELEKEGEHGLVDLKKPPPQDLAAILCHAGFVLWGNWLQLLQAVWMGE